MSVPNHLNWVGISDAFGGYLWDGSAKNHDGIVFIYQLYFEALDWLQLLVVLLHWKSAD